MAIISLMRAGGEVREKPSEAGKLLRRLLLPFGGGDFFFTPAETPLFILDLTLPADNNTGANFDIRLAYAVAAIARDHGTPRVVFGVRTEAGFNFEDVLEKSGYAKLRDLAGVEFLDLREAPLVERDSDIGLTLDDIKVYQPAATADIIISLAKFKAGEGHLFGGALNNVGLISAISDDFGYQQRQRALVDVFSVIAPDLTIVDGLKGSSGFQPQDQDFVLAAIDAVACDAVLAAMADIPPEEIDYLQLAAQYGLGVGEPNDIRLYGDDMGEIM